MGHELQREGLGAPALSCVLQAFPLGELLHLLAAFDKSGTLALSSGPGDAGGTCAEIVLVAGAVASIRSEIAGSAGWAGAGDGEAQSGSAGSGSAGSGSSGSEVLAELMRRPGMEAAFYPEGAGGTASTGQAGAIPVAELVGPAEELVSRWEKVEEVLGPVPQRLHLVGELEGPALTIGQDQWRMVAWAGRPFDPAEAAGELGLSRLECYEQARSLLELGVLAPEPADGWSAERGQDLATREQAGPGSEPAEPAGEAARPIQELVSLASLSDQARAPAGAGVLDAGLLARFLSSIERDPAPPSRGPS
ncbi:MAG: hypothetical protein ACYDH5_07550 [Acidimicrobiales bacterium]